MRATSSGHCVSWTKLWRACLCRLTSHTCLTVCWRSVSAAWIASNRGMWLLSMPAGPPSWSRTRRLNSHASIVSRSARLDHFLARKPCWQKVNQAGKSARCWANRDSPWANRQDATRHILDRQTEMAPATIQPADSPQIAVRSPECAEEGQPFQVRRVEPHVFAGRAELRRPHLAAPANRLTQVVETVAQPAAIPDQKMGGIRRQRRYQQYAHTGQRQIAVLAGGWAEQPAFTSSSRQQDEIEDRKPGSRGSQIAHQAIAPGARRMEAAASLASPRQRHNDQPARHQQGGPDQIDCHSVTIPEKPVDHRPIFPDHYPFQLFHVKGATLAHLTRPRSYNLRPPLPG